MALMRNLSGTAGINLAIEKDSSQRILTEFLLGRVFLFGGKNEDRNSIRPTPGNRRKNKRYEGSFGV